MTRLIRPDCWLGRKPSVRKKNLRFGIVYSYHAKVSPLYKQAVSNREKYCDAVGVACIDQSDFVIESLRKEGKVCHYVSCCVFQGLRVRITWVLLQSSFNLAAVLKLKITSIINAIENNSGLDWILFTDIDILILNFELKLSEMVSRVPDETIMIISPDAKTINTGCFFVRADEDGLDLLKSWHSTFINKQFISDQQAFNSLYNTLARRNGKDCNMDESDKSNHGSVKSCYDFHDQIPEIFVPRQVLMRRSQLRYMRC